MSEEEAGIDPKEAERIYTGLYEMLEHAIGKRALGEVFHVDENGFDPGDPMGSLMALRDNVSRGFGERTVNNMFLVFVRSEFSPSDSQRILNVLGIQ